MTLEAVGPPPATLHIDIDGAELCARTRSPVDPGERVQWIPLDRTDEEIAAYLMQDWMQRL